MNIQKLLVLLFFVTISPKILRGQDDVKDSAFFSFRKMVKVNLVAAIDPFEPTFAASFEHRLKPQHYMEHELGYIYDNPWKTSAAMRGYRYRLGYHYVFMGRKSSFEYLGVQLHYRRLFGEAEDFRWRQGYAFQQIIKSQQTFHSYGFTFLTGEKTRLGKNSPWVLDLQVGLGLSWRPFRIENYPKDAEAPNLPSWLYYGQTYINEGNTVRNAEKLIYPSLLLTFKLCYIIN